MRIVQLIDSLEVGGAERMAVNYANALAGQVAFSGIVASRKQGALKSRIDSSVFFACLNKRFTFDFSAIFTLRRLCKMNKVDWIHAHGTSYFTAFLLKLVYPQINIIWHEHAGARSEKKTIYNIVLWFIMRFFCGIIVVNHDLEKWCKEKLFFEKVIYLPNFTVFNGNEVKKTTLEGIEGKRIVCLANLRHPKNHKLLLEVAIKLRKTNPEWTFHFIGKDLHDEYSNELKTIIKANSLEESVFIYDVREDIDHILQQASIGVLASSSEGLPVAVLEYGMHSMAVVATNVGEIPQVVADGISGLIVPSDMAALFYDALMLYINSTVLINTFGVALKDTITASHTESAVIANYINWLQNELTC